MAKAFVADTARTFWPRFRQRAPGAPDKGRVILLARASFAISGAARVMDSSVYHLASVLIGRCVGRMTP
ncbi:hypothetical protein LMTR13_34150 [Bradyrhizobium icense]|uniref:Uncharacterized protein n=1 Tax=Bradyrhizobium icense TaxID=1274631 RepID=A0A1B1UNY8_9BRAD|nr:hypothetical protein LMTR13_34150 [Bradyrhizobium icense]